MRDVLLVAVDVALCQGVDPHFGDDPSGLGQGEITGGPAQMCDVFGTWQLENAGIICWPHLSTIPVQQRPPGLFL